MISGMDSFSSGGGSKKYSNLFIAFLISFFGKGKITLVGGWCSESVETSLNETPKFKAIDK
jgi:hypothetical protein